MRDATAAPDFISPDDLTWIDMTSPNDLAVSDRSPPPDVAFPVDVAMPDFAMRDFAMPDLATPDFAMPDLATPDFAMPDLAMPDFAMPDFAMPDFAMPDFAMPDFAKLDFAMPDLTIPPDLSRPDLVCVPRTCNGLGKNCGMVSDGCGGTLNCGSCPYLLTCGANGQPNVCGCDATGWAFTVVDNTSADTGYDASIFVDAQGGRHISYWDLKRSMVRYARLPAGAGAWTLEDVVAYTAFSTDLALDSQGNVHVVYGQHAVRAASGGWTLDNVQFGTRAVAIAIDASDTLHVSHGHTFTMAGETFTALGYAKRPKNGNWTLMDIDSVDTTLSGDDHANYSDIAVDVNNAVHIAYSSIHNNPITNFLWYVTSLDGWTPHGLAGTGGFSISIALDAKVNRYFTHTDPYFDAGNIHHLFSQNGIQSMDSVAFAGVRASIAIHPSGVPHIAAITSGSKFEYGIRMQNTWSTQMVASAIGQVNAPSLAIDKAGASHVAYYDGKGNQLVYGYRCPP